MQVWVNVWGMLARRAALLALGLLAFGCIDDFDDPKGYGPRNGTSGGTFGTKGLTCSDLCEESASCGDGTNANECRDQCSQLTEISRRAGCEDDLDDVLDCLAGLSNLCSQQDRCSNIALDFSDCVTRYCETHPSDYCAF